MLNFDIPSPTSTESDLRNPDRAQLRADILAMREHEMSYRNIATEAEPFEIQCENSRAQVEGSHLCSYANTDIAISYWCK